MNRRSADIMCLFRIFIQGDFTLLEIVAKRDAIYDYSEREVNSFYGSAELSYKDFLFLNGTVRNDWFSTLSPANRSILISGNR